MVTKEQIEAGMQVVLVVAQAIHAAGSAGMPSGHLYAMLMGKMELSQYERIIGILVKNGIIRKDGHVLTSLLPA
jgi:hypothetical protein